VGDDLLYIVFNKAGMLGFSPFFYIIHGERMKLESNLKVLHYPFKETNIYKPGVRLINKS
jgi:hypothetical protein